MCHEGRGVALRRRGRVMMGRRRTEPRRNRRLDDAVVDAAE